MSIYIVYVQEVWATPVIIRADSAEEARELVDEGGGTQVKDTRVFCKKCLRPISAKRWEVIDVQDYINNLSKGGSI